MYFVDVILPVPLEGLFTYGLPEQWAAQVTMGVRVLVPLGKSKHYIAMAVRVHQTEPQVKWKNIEQVLDDKPVLRQEQMRLWQWISDYYMSPIGDVFKAAMPSGMKTEEGYRPRTETFLDLAEKWRSEQNLHLAGVRTMQAQEMYGQISEKIVSIINERSRSKFEDPLSEDAEGSEQPEEVHTLGKVVSFGRTHKSGKGRRTTDTSSLPEVTYYDYDIEKLNEQFGEGNWRFFSWDRHETREIQRRYAYRKVTYAPVISYGLEHMLYRMPYEGSIIPKSSVSSSLLASILSDYANIPNL